MAYKPISDQDLEDDLALEIDAEPQPFNEKTALLNDNKANGTEAPKPTPKFSRTDLQRLAGLAKEERLFISIGTISLVIATAANLIVPATIGGLIDSIFTDQMSNITQAIFYLFLFFAIVAIFTFIRYTLFTIAGERVVTRLRGRLFKAILSQDVAFFDKNRTGELTSRLSSDCTVIQDAVTVNISMFLRSLIGAIGGFIVIFSMSWKLTLIMFAVLPFAGVGAWIYGRFIKTISTQFQDKIAHANIVAEESFSNIRIVRAFSSEKFEKTNYDSEVWAAFALAKKRAYSVSVFSAVFLFIVNLGTCGVLWYGSKMVVSKELTVGGLTSFLIYTLNIGVAFSTLTSLFADFMKAVGATQRVFELIEREPDVRAKGGLHLYEVLGNVKVDNISFSYPSRADVTVLKDVSLELEPGKVVALVGPSGGGKSTVVSLIEGFYYPDSGKITLDNNNLKDIDPRFLHKHVAIVNQEPSLFARTIAENIAYAIDEQEFGSEQEKMLRVIDAAKMANAHEFITSFPDGYQTIVGERGVRLSGGQKQRIAIARALIRNPRVLLLDEATSALDAESEWAVKEAIDNLLKTSDKRSVLIIAHRLSTVQNADEVIVIHKGRVVERGNHNDLIARDGVYKKLVSRQLQK
jgi:ATP-binding cassette subfamily B protein